MVAAAFSKAICIQGIAHAVYGKIVVDTSKQPVQEAAITGFEKQKGFASDVVKGIYIFIELKGLIDVDKERLRLTKKITELEKKFETLRKKLANKNFIEKAPEEIVKNTEESRKKIEEELKKKKSILDQIK